MKETTTKAPSTQFIQNPISEKTAKPMRQQSIVNMIWILGKSQMRIHQALTNNNAKTVATMVSNEVIWKNKAIEISNMVQCSKNSEMI